MIYDIHIHISNRIIISRIYFLEALRMWEACWSHYQTDYFHLFICISIMAVYGDDIVQQNLGTDDMLLHFNSLAMHMSGSIVLRKVKKQENLFLKIFIL